MNSTLEKLIIFDTTIQKKRVARAAYALLILISACGYQSQRPQEKGTDSSTHWLRWCDCNTDCGSLQCECGVCTKACDDEEACRNAGLSGACQKSAGRECDDAHATKVCVLECSTDADCDQNHPNLTCINGQCIPVDEPTEKDAAGQGREPRDDANDPEDSKSDAGSGIELRDSSGELSDASETVDSKVQDAETPDARETVDSEVQDAGAQDTGNRNTCAPMDALSGGLLCLEHEGWAWTGSACQPITCDCVGSECEALYPSAQACQEAHASCLNGIYSYCNATDECTFSWESCCAPCNPDTIDVFVAMRVESLPAFEAYRNTACEGIACMPNPSACLPYYGYYPYIASTCSIPEGTDQGVCAISYSDDATCDDLGNIDFGTCDTVLGWAVVDGVCGSVSGCSDLGYGFFMTKVDCLSHCASSCDEWNDAFNSVFEFVSRCTTADDCFALVGTSCGCTRDLVANKTADLTEFWGVVNSMSDAECGLGSDCDCPEADGFICQDEHCAWNYL